VGDGSRAIGRRFLAALGLVLIAVVVLYQGLMNLWIGGSPKYRACAAAMRQVTVGMPWPEAERHIAAAVKAGGERWEPGPDVLALQARDSDIQPGTVQVTCWHFGSGRVIAFRRWLVAVDPTTADRNPYCTSFDLRKVDEHVALARAENCVPPDR
jgi:hypothetical protein